MTKPLDRERLAESIDRQLSHLEPPAKMSGSQGAAAPRAADLRQAADAPRARDMPAAADVSSTADAPGAADAPDAATEASSGSPVDWDEFTASMDGDDAFAEQLLELFVDSGDASLREIREALRRGDLPAVGRAAHAIKGSSANIRARHTSAAASRLEEAAKAGEMDRLASLEEDLNHETGRVREFLRARRA